MATIDNLGNKQILAKNLQYYLKVHNKDSADICKKLNIPPSTFSEWINAKKYPRMDKLELLANFFGIKKSDLIEEKFTDNIFNKTQVLFDKTKDILSDDDRATIEFIMQKTIDNYEKEKNKRE